MSASDTPRTDAAVKQYDGSWFALGGPAGDLLVLCRELERELAVMKNERDEWHDQTGTLVQQLFVAEQKISALKKERDEWKAKAEANIPLAVGWMYAEACVLVDKGEDIREIQAPYFLQRALLDLCHHEYDSARSAEKEKE